MALNGLRRGLNILTNRKRPFSVHVGDNIIYYRCREYWNDDSYLLYYICLATIRHSGHTPPFIGWTWYRWEYGFWFSSPWDGNSTHRPADFRNRFHVTTLKCFSKTYSKAHSHHSSSTIIWPWRGQPTFSNITWFGRHSIKKLIKQFKKNQKNFKNMLRVRFIGTSSGDYEFKPYDLIGEVILKNVHTPYITYDCNIFAILVCGKIGSWKFNDCLTSRAGGLISNTPELGGQSASSWGQIEINVLYIYYTVCCIFVFTNIFKNEWKTSFSVNSAFIKCGVKATVMWPKCLYWC